MWDPYIRGCLAISLTCVAVLRRWLQQVNSSEHVAAFLLLSSFSDCPAVIITWLRYVHIFTRIGTCYVPSQYVSSCVHAEYGTEVCPLSGPYSVETSRWPHQKSVEILLPVRFRHFGKWPPVCFSTSMICQESISIETSRLRRLQRIKESYTSCLPSARPRRYILLKNHALATSTS